MSLKLLGSLQSTCTQRVLLVCNELGLEPEFVEISMQQGEHKHPDYVKNHHPFGVLPALEDSKFRLFESRAICRYLVAKYGKDTDLNVDKNATPAEIGTFEQVSSIDYSYFDPSVKTLAYENMFKRFMGHGDPDPQVVENNKNILSTALDYYERVLSSRQHLGGQKFGLVDIYHIPWFHFFEKLDYQDEIAVRPNLTAWWKRVNARPSVQSLLQVLPAH